MSKVTFRAKALEHSRKMAIYIGDDIPEMTDFAIVNRTVPEMPTGMEKEEETQHHLQKALSTQQSFGSVTNLIIPIPELGGAVNYERVYSTRAGFAASKKFVHVQPSTTDQELPDYDMDTEDERWLEEHRSVYADLGSDPVRFENMVDKLEKGSGHLVVKLNEAKALIKEKEDVVIAVYDYWLNKRLRQEKKIKEALASKMENASASGCPPSSTVNPYLAFRKRAEKMQTRKNRKNDEQSYLGILQLKKSFEKAKQLFEMVKLRESCKKDLVETKKLIFNKRYELGDWTGEFVKEAEGGIGPLHLPDWSHLFAHRSIVEDENLVQVSCSSASPFCHRQKYIAGSSNGFAEDSSRCGVERPRKRRKKHHRRSRGRHEGSDAASEEDDGIADEFKAGGSIAIDDREELDELSRTLSFFGSWPASQGTFDGAQTEEEAVGSDGCLLDSSEDELLPDGKYAFKRREGCFYEAPIPFKSMSDEDCNSFASANQVFMPDRLQVGQTFSLATLANPPTSGFMRRRVGRGGRVVIDRIPLDSSDIWERPRCLPLRMRRKRAVQGCDGGSLRGAGHQENIEDRSILRSGARDQPQVDDNSNAPMPEAKGLEGTENLRGDDIFPGKSSLTFLSDPRSSPCSGRGSSAPSSASMLLTSFSSSDKLIARMSRASFLSCSSLPTSGYKRKCSNRTDSEDSGVCSPSPTPSTGSFPGVSNGASSDKQPNLKARGASSSSCSSARASDAAGPVRRKDGSYACPEADDGISDDHSMNGDSCSSFSDHRAKANPSSESSSDLVDYALNVPGEGRRLIIPQDKRSGLSEVGSQLMRKHLSSFDSKKFTLLASKIAKENGLKVVAQPSVGGDIMGNRGSKGLRYQCQMKLSDVNNLVNLNGEVITALEVS